MMKKTAVLFLCTGNSCRSQMAEGWAHHLKSDILDAYSAGIIAQGLNPFAVQVMAEVGVDISQQKSKTVDSLRGVDLDYVVTVCSHAHETCPTYFGDAQVVHHGFLDPPAMARKVADQGGNETDQLNCYRKVRDEIRAYISSLPEALKENAHE
ncbi:MAG: arsenate reductase ArsC [Acidobacteria bacterium]|nr:arsenate reductase ArsC [Acidobacteriota bacterium]